MNVLSAIELQVPPCCPYCGAPKAPRILIAHIQHVVAAYYGLPTIALVRPGNTRPVAWARQMAMYLARELTSQSLPYIGLRFQRDHSTVLHAVRAVSKRIDENEEWARDYLVLRERLLWESEE